MMAETTQHTEKNATDIVSVMVKMPRHMRQAIKDEASQAGVLMNEMSNRLILSGIGVIHGKRSGFSGHERNVKPDGTQVGGLGVMPTNSEDAPNVRDEGKRQYIDP